MLDNYQFIFGALNMLLFFLFGKNPQNLYWDGDSIIIVKQDQIGES